MSRSDQKAAPLSSRPGGDRRRSHLVVAWSQQVCQELPPLCARLRWFSRESCVWPDLGWWSWRHVVLFRCLVVSQNRCCCSALVSVVATVLPQGLRYAASVGLAGAFWRVFPERRVGGSGGGSPRTGLCCFCSFAYCSVLYDGPCCLVIWVVRVLVKVLPRIALCRLWRRFFPEVLCVHFGPLLCCPCDSKCAVWLGYVLVRDSYRCFRLDCLCYSLLRRSSQGFVRLATLCVPVAWVVCFVLDPEVVSVSWDPHPREPVEGVLRATSVLELAAHTIPYKPSGSLAMRTSGPWRGFGRLGRYTHCTGTSLKYSVLGT
ncbi:hypothetical protein Taro_004121 [Colocasia esculenta]|uniref:Uncharacterized protein n=1 Tax=Colocasia esculenta TaxID=4460 RepID=A0A843THD6_COLES|nr:hypothetical protein [Colocasia esculenta]